MVYSKSYFEDVLKSSIDDALEELPPTETGTFVLKLITANVIAGIVNHMYDKGLAGSLDIPIDKFVTLYMQATTAVIESNNNYVVMRGMITATAIAILGSAMPTLVDEEEIEL